MIYENMGQPALEYYPCRYGRSRVLFRGPKRKLDGQYAAFLGGTETYGRFIETPFPARVERMVGRSCVNFGGINAGVDLYLNDPEVLAAADAAAVTVIQVMGAQNMSNRFYSVHPRRNDRFLKASTLLQKLYRDVDFTEFHFTRHMLKRLQDISAERFEIVADELKAAWSARMRQLIAQVRGPVVLLWVCESGPVVKDDPELAGEVLLVDRQMIDDLRPRVSAVVQFTPSTMALEQGTRGMVFSDIEAPAALDLMGPAAHEEIAHVLSDTVAAYLKH